MFKVVVLVLQYICILISISGSHCRTNFLKTSCYVISGGFKSEFECGECVNVFGYMCVRVYVCVCVRVFAFKCVFVCTSLLASRFPCVLIYTFYKTLQFAAYQNNRSNQAIYIGTA